MAVSLARLAAALHSRVWLIRAVTLGVRIVVLDAGRVFLVRHTYTEGWYLPGGGVDRGETAEAAACRELVEEGLLRCLDRPVLHGFYRNGHHDHVACFVTRSVAPEEGARRSWEIAESGWFPFDALPEAATPATRSRLAEVLEGREVSPDW